MLPPIQDLVYLHVTLLLCQSKTQIMQWWAESCLSCFPAPYSLRLYSCPSGEASVMLQLGKTRTRLLMDPHRFIPSALLLRYAAVWGLCTLAWPWAEEFPCGGTRGWAGCQGKLTEVWGCGTVWSCVFPDIGHMGNRNAFFCVIQAVVESLNICLVGHTQKNLHFDTAIPSSAANDCCVQNFRLTKSRMMKN